MTRRYAIYLAPPVDSALWRFGSRVLGRDAETGETLAGFAPPGLRPEDWRTLTEEPRRYGFHATLKAPFRLDAGRSADELEAAAAELAAGVAPFDLGPLRVSCLGAGGGFVALTPLNAPPALRELEARALRELDRFRAPATDEDIARRRPESLTARQREHLAAWGYPYVLDEFRLHFTLSGATPDPQPLAEALAQAFAQAVPARDYRVEDLALFVQEAGGDFRVRRRFPLNGRTRGPERG